MFISTWQYASVGFLSVLATVQQAKLLLTDNYVVTDFFYHGDYRDAVILSPLRNYIMAAA